MNSSIKCAEQQERPKEVQVSNERDVGPYTFRLPTLTADEEQAMQEYQQRGKDIKRDNVLCRRIDNQATSGGRPTHGAQQHNHDTGFSDENRIMNLQELGRAYEGSCLRTRQLEVTYLKQAEITRQLGAKYLKELNREDMDNDRGICDLSRASGSELEKLCEAARLEDEQIRRHEAAVHGESRPGHLARQLETNDKELEMTQEQLEMNEKQLETDEALLEALKEEMDLRLNVLYKKADFTDEEILGRAALIQSNALRLPPRFVPQQIDMSPNPPAHEHTWLVEGKELPLPSSGSVPCDLSKMAISAVLNDESTSASRCSFQQRDNHSREESTTVVESAMPERLVETSSTVVKSPVSPGKRKRDSTSSTNVFRQRPDTSLASAPPSVWLALESEGQDDSPQTEKRHKGPETGDELMRQDVEAEQLPELGEWVPPSLDLFPRSVWRRY